MREIPPATPPKNVRAAMADGREIPLECRYVGWDPQEWVHRWEAVHRLPEPPVSLRMAVLPGHTSVAVGMEAAR